MLHLVLFHNDMSEMSVLITQHSNIVTSFVSSLCVRDIIYNTDVVTATNQGTERVINKCSRSLYGNTILSRPRNPTLTHSREILEKSHRKSAVSLGQGRNFVFQEDNDPKHTTKLIEKYIADNEIDVHNRPSQSTDLNLIEICGTF